jgi:hypothetical protein
MKENAVKSAATYKPYDRRGDVKRRPGRPVGVIAVKAKDIGPDDYNPSALLFVVSPYRKDYKKVIQQNISSRKAMLPKYERDLFKSCFKNW